MNDKDAADLAGLGKRRHVPKSAYIFQAGDLAAQVYLIEHGQAKVFYSSPTGPRVLLFFSGEGEIIGLHETVLGNGQRTHASLAQASEDCVVSAVPVERLLAFLATHFRTAHYVIEALSFRIDETNEKLASFAAADIGARVARIILHMSACYGQHIGKAVELGVPITQQELANIVGAARQTVNGVIQTLKSDGVISISKQFIRIEDETTLQRIAMRDDPDTQND